MFLLGMWKRSTASFFVGGIATDNATIKWKQKRKQYKRNKISNFHEVSVITVNSLENDQDVNVLVGNTGPNTRRLESLE